jgi:hypothetical protein
MPRNLEENESMDPIHRLFEKWAAERRAFERSGSRELIALSETHERELHEVLSELSEAEVPYRRAEALTGFALGSLKNTVSNVGDRRRPAFRLIDLPFKAGYASPAKVIMARTILQLMETP